ncbi:MAG: hypothetical protein R2754_17175 [Microthrixaceae bacterium]
MSQARPTGGPGSALAPDHGTGGAGSTAVLALASAGAGLLAYAFVVVGTRTYGGAAFAGVAQVWSIWFVGAAVLTFPVQHWIVTTATVDGDFERVRRALPGLGALVLGAAVALGLLSAVLGERLFDSPKVAYPVALAGVTLGAGLAGVLRGSLAARGRFTAVGGAIVGEGLLRLAVGAAVAGAGGGVAAYGLTVASGLVVALCWRSAWRFGPPTPGPAPRLAHVLGGLGGGNLIAQGVLTGGPVALALIGGSSSEVTALFVTLALLRAPYLVMLGVSVRITATLSVAAVGGAEALAGRWRQLMLAALGGAPLAAVAAVLLGPWAIRLVFGADIAITRGVAAAVGCGSALAVANLIASLLSLVEGRSSAVLVAWLAGAAGALTMLAAGFGPLNQVLAAFLLAETIAFAAMAMQWLRSSEPAPGVEAS